MSFDQYEIIRTLMSMSIGYRLNSKIRCILNDCGMSYIWNIQNCISDKWLKLVVKNNLVDQFKQTWTSMIMKCGSKYFLRSFDKDGHSNR
jgi:hypothetical protein